MNTLYLLDVSGYLFRSYYALPRMTNPAGLSTHALYGFIRSVLKIIKDFSPTHIIAVFDGEDNKRGRKKIYEDYKSHRMAIPEDLPFQIEQASFFCDLFGIPKLAVEGVEADDTIASVATWAANLGSIVYLCTADKDICQLVNDRIFVLHTHKENLKLDRTKVEELYGVPPEMIADLLALTGDSSDNIPGVSGIGPKTAAVLLKEFGSLENILAEPFKVSGAKRQEALMKEAEIARFSKQLALLDYTVDFPKEPSFFELKSASQEPLRQFYQKMNFASFLKEMKTAEPSFTLDLEFDAPAQILQNYRLIDSLEELAHTLNYLKGSKIVCFDTETTGLNPLQASLVGVGFAVKAAEAFYVPTNGLLGYQAVVEALKPFFADPSIAFFGHNIKYDLHVLHTAGIEVANVDCDTMLLSYLLHSHSHRHSLDHLAGSHLQKGKEAVKDLLKEAGKGATMADLPVDRVSAYCCTDVDLTWQLREKMEDELLKEGLKPLFEEIEMPLLRVLQQMEERGIFVDHRLLQKLSIEFASVIHALQEEIYQLAKEPFNINSPKQLSEILFGKLSIKPLKKTPTGTASTNADVLNALSVDYPIAAKIVQYRTLEKLRSTYIDALPTQINPATGRIHPTFNQFVAATGRLSCQDPNLQNIPIRTEEGRKIREAFCPQKPGWSYVSADYSQIELRLLAHLSQDPHLIAAFQQGADIHSFTAAQVFGIPQEAVTKDIRRQAKAVNFGIIYGQQAFGLSQGTGLSMKEAARFIEAYFDRYPHVRDYLEECKRQARLTGKAVTMTKRQRLIEDINSKNNNLRQAAERLAINTPLQGTAADIIKMAMIKVDYELKKINSPALMILQIHDELLFEVPDEIAKEVADLVKKAMESVVVLAVPLTVDIGIGKNWKEC